ncbi:hypothetical protein MasN3_03460 [Massilia varians]|uniref:HTH-like domain-containing protein n=1 Tax=Massilia varians TaxID=457921 RepID=A0ABM8C119_9BURK|nr:hypothetical protein MasN3_03460 [Massilia varians]
MRLDFPDYSVKLMCQVLDVSHSGYYDSLRAKPFTRRHEDARLKILITAVHRQTRETYGVPRIKRELASQGHEVGRDRVRRLRQELNLRCKQRRKFIATTNSNHNLPVAENLLEQRFAPNRADLPFGPWKRILCPCLPGAGSAVRNARVNVAPREML